ncbi:50S ribosomal protein L15, partial [Candidatus Parcubacteria bacterium]|nr:50S ribosomal protein L15 [Candidatus Parcubacteria bacterium]
MKLSNLPKLKGTHRPAKWVGRGYGSGKGGHTVGRGQKGQKSRGKVPLWFEGGQLPLARRLPHRGGFTPLHHKEPAIFNIGRFSNFEGETVTPKQLVEMGWLKKVPRDGVKILGVGTLAKALNFSGFEYSKTAV